MTQLGTAIMDCPDAIAYWPLDEASGNAIDRIGGRTAVKTGAGMLQAQPAIVPNGDGACTFFSGASGEYYTLGSVDPTIDFVGTLPYSVESWVSPADAAGSRYPISNRKTVPAAGQGGGMTPYWGGSENLAFYRYDVNGVADILGGNTPTNVVNGGVAHCVCSFDGTMRSIYFNGVVKAGPTVAASSMGAGNPWRIGGAAFTASASWFGAIQEVAIYNDALDPARVWQHYQIGAANEIAPDDVEESTFTPIGTPKGSFVYGPNGASVDLASVTARGSIVTRDPYLINSARQLGVFSES